MTFTGLKNVDIQIEGNLHLPQDIPYVQNLVNATDFYTGYWFRIEGHNIDLVGSKYPSCGWINSYGQKWWDENKGTGLPNRPHLMWFNGTDSTITNHKSRKPIAWGLALYGKNVTIKNSFIDATTTPDGGFPFNTDAFDIVASNVTIEDSTILNGDDAFAIQSGSHDVVIRGGLLAGPGCHGMSIGSLGQNQGKFANVSNILFDDISVHGAVYGARFKSWIGGQGYVENITWSNIRVSNVTFPIFVTQTYFNQGSAQTQIENGAVVGRPNNASVIMNNFRWENWTGAINSYQPGDRSCASNPCWYNAGLPTVDGTQGIIFECTDETTCKNFVVKGVDVMPEIEKPTSVICMNVAAESNKDLGFECKNGTYAPWQ